MPTLMLYADSDTALGTQLVKVRTLLSFYFSAASDIPGVQGRVLLLASRQASEMPSMHAATDVGLTHRGACYK